MSDLVKDAKEQLNVDLTDLVDEGPEGDISPEEWLSEPEDAVTGRVRLHNGKTMRVAAITQDEYVAIRRMSQRAGLDPKNPHRVKIDTEMMARRLVCHAVNKAAGKSDLEGVQPAQLGSRLTGNLINLQKQILRISGLDEESMRVDNTDDFLA